MGWRNLKRTPKKHYRARSSDDPAFDDTHHYYCKACGFPCNTKYVTTREILNADLESGEWLSGISYKAVTDADYVNVTGGCPKCGSFDSR